MKYFTIQIALKLLANYQCRFRGSLPVVSLVNNMSRGNFLVTF